MEPKFGAFEGFPVRYTSREAWWKPQANWVPINAAEIYMGAEPLKRPEYERRFPNLPPLPATAFPVVAKPAPPDKAERPSKFEWEEDDVVVRGPDGKRKGGL